MKFACTECARCCRNLMESKAKGLPPGASRMAEGGVYALPRQGGLQAWSWEVARMHAAAGRLGTSLPFVPSMGMVVEREGARRFVALVYELTVNSCPLVREDNRCGAYEDRPTVCRAYPLLLTGSSITISTKCPGAVDAEPAGLRSAYGGAARAVEHAHQLPQVVGRQLAFFEREGAFRMVRGLPEGEVAGLAAQPVDLLPFLEEIGAREGFVTAVADARAAAEG